MNKKVFFMRQQQQKIKSSQDRFTITLPIDLAKQVREVTKRQNISISLFTRQAIETKLEQMAEGLKGKELTINERRDFMELPKEARRKIMEEQAAAIHKHYERDTEWRELQGGDIVEY